MRKLLYNSIFPIALFVLISFTPGRAQNGNSANVNISIIDFSLSDYQAVFLSDFNFLQVGASKELFKVILTKGEGAITNAVIRFDFNLEGQSLAFSETKVFSLSAAPDTWTFSNVDLARGFSIDADTKLEIAESGVSDIADNLKNEIFASNQLPVGSYVLESRISFNDLVGTPGEVVDKQIFTISNPTMINLVAPGVELNSGYVYDIYSSQPMFQWNGNSGEYEVVVFKKESEFNSVEDILNSEEIWHSPKISTLSVQYPSNSTYPLEYDQSYVWLVKSFIKTSSGENAINSEIWEFTLKDPAKAAQTEEGLAKQELETLLRQLLGDNANGVIQQLKNLSLKTIRVNGSSITVKELYDYLEKYRNEKHQLSGLIIR